MTRLKKIKNYINIIKIKINKSKSDRYSIFLQHLDAFKSNKAKRQKLRERLVKVIVGGEEQLNTLQREVAAGWRPESELVRARRRMMRRYKVYVEKGMDSSSVAPIEQSWIEHIIRFLPRRLKARKAFLVELVKELQEEYLVHISVHISAYKKICSSNASALCIYNRY